MTGPNPNQVSVATEALRTAGTTWEHQAGPLRSAGQAANTYPVALSTTEMGLAAPISGAYHDLCSGLNRVLSEAADQADAIGSALVYAAGVYEAEEQENIHRIKGVW
jgi:hypothetical protein